MQRYRSNQPLGDYLSVSEAAKFLGVSTWTLRNWDKSGKLKARRHPVNGHRLYFHEDLQSMLNLVISRRPAPSINWDDVGESDHIVQFYDSDHFLVESVADYIATGLMEGGNGIIIGIEEHNRSIERLMTSRGIDVPDARDRGELVVLEARETLACFMFGGAPDPQRFRDVIGILVDRLAQEGKPVRAFGEMVALLWAEGNSEAAIRLEELWCDLGKSYTFSLLCAYPMALFGGRSNGKRFDSVCKHHTRVIPADGYVQLTTIEDRDREVARLQQTALALEAEIAHRQEVERELARRERELADFFENALEGIHRVGPDGTILWANRAELQMLGYDETEYIGRHIGEFHVDPETIECMLAKLQRGEPLYDYPARLRCKDGSIRHVRVHSNAYMENGRFVYSRCFTRDVTERLRAEGAQREAEHKFAGFMQHLPGLAWMKDVHGRYVFVNDAAQKVFQAPRAQLYGKTDRDLFSAETAKQFESNDRKALGSRAGVLVVETLEHEDGLVHHSLVSKFPIPDADGKPTWVGGMAIDITNRIRAEEALREADQRKDEFLATLAHELRNPLTPIRNALEIMRINGHDGPLHEMISRQVRILSRLVDDLLELSRITRGMIELRREHVDLASVVDNAVESSRSLIVSVGHILKIEITPGPLVVDVDPVRLSQVIANLLNNAAKYTDPGGEIRLKVEREGDSGVIRVRDTGIGIPPEMLPRIFEMFTQVNRSSRRAQGGLGIGLALVRTLVTMHGGTVEAQSAGIGCGSEFTVRLPLVRCQAGGHHEESDAACMTPPSGGLRVLIVDDNRDAAETLGLLLDTTDCETELAFHGQAALSAMERFRPEVVFLDLGLPGMDGYEVARRIRARSEFDNVILIALSGWGKDEDRRRSQESGINHHLIKPAEFETIQALLESIRAVKRKR